MRVTSLRLDQSSKPSSITVDMDIDEAAFVAKVLGQMRGTDQSKIMAKGNEIGSEIYSCLTGEVFNRYWEDGVDEVIR